jgi:hypothetical protein
VVSLKTRLLARIAGHAVCVDSGWMKRNPAKVLKPPKVKPTSKMPFTEDEVRCIVAACDLLKTQGRYSTNENIIRLKAFILVCGTRSSESPTREARYVTSAGR